MMTYLIGAIVTFGIMLHAFLSDRASSKRDRISWSVLVVASLFWFVSLVFILRRKWTTHRMLSERVNQPAV